jgi:hypothetical protein
MTYLRIRPIYDADFLPKNKWFDIIQHRNKPLFSLSPNFLFKNNDFIKITGYYKVGCRYINAVSGHHALYINAVKMDESTKKENSVNKQLAGIISGFLATVVISLLMVLKEKYGLIPDLNIIEDFSQYFSDESRTIGWVIHFVLGSIIWGGVFAIVMGILPGAYWFRGILFAIGVWALMMVGYMPVMEHGFFAKELGIEVIIATFVIHIIFGLVLGITFGFLYKEK